MFVSFLAPPLPSPPCARLRHPHTPGTKPRVQATPSAGAGAHLTRAGGRSQARDSQSPPLAAAATAPTAGRPGAPLLPKLIVWVKAGSQG